jgi:hypothetical protein
VEIGVNTKGKKTRGYFFDVERAFQKVNLPHEVGGDKTETFQ